MSEVFSFTGAAQYLGQSRANLKHHYYNTQRLPGQKKGKTIVFTRAQLDWFAEIDFTVRPPLLPARPAPPAPALFTFDEAAALLDLHRSTLEQAYYAKQLKGRLVGHVVLFTRAQVEAFRRQQAEAQYARGRDRKPVWTPARERILAALAKHRRWHEPHLWKGRGVRDTRWGWWVVGPGGRSEFLGRNVEDALKGAKPS